MPRDVRSIEKRQTADIIQLYNPPAPWAHVPEFTSWINHCLRQQGLRCLRQLSSTVIFDGIHVHSLPDFATGRHAFYSQGYGGFPNERSVEAGRPNRLPLCAVTPALRRNSDDDLRAGEGRDLRAAWTH